MQRTPRTPAAWWARVQQRLRQRLYGGLRIALSQYVVNGLTVSLGLVLILLTIHELAGLLAASTAGVGVLITSLPDVPAPRKRKIMQVLPAPLLGGPLFMLVQLVRQSPLELGVVLLLGTFLSVMVMAWGKRGGAISFSLLFSMLFSMAAPPTGTLEQIALHGAWFMAGAGLYLLWAVLTTHLLNRRFRAQLLAECLNNFAGILCTQAQRFGAAPDHGALLASLLAQQAALADHLQNTRDVVLESPTTRPRQRTAAILLALLEARDHQLSCDMDLEFLLQHHPDAAHLPALQQTLTQIADELQVLSLDLLLGRVGTAVQMVGGFTQQLTHQISGLLFTAAPAPQVDRPLAKPQALSTVRPDTAVLQANLADRVGHIAQETQKITDLISGQRQPELAAVRTQWQLFVSATTWSWTPLLGQLTWRAPTLRYAVRATLAVGTGYVVALHLPWVAHEYWILLTIVVVMRGNLAQTVQRRNARVGGTLMGCLLVMLLLAAQPDTRTLFLVIALGMGLAHAFALRRYLYTAIASTVSGLLQAHLLLAAVSPTFAISERLADTLLGAAIAWLFSYVLPSWERNQIPGLIKRSLAAQLKHAKLAMALSSTPQTTDLVWRLARRDAYNSVSDLTLATQRSLAEPRQVRPPVEPLEAVQARSYQLLAQLTVVKSLLLLHRPQLDMAQAAPALAQASQSIEAELGDSAALPAPPLPTTSLPVPPLAGQPFQARPDLLAADDLTPWLLHRLAVAHLMAHELRLAVARAAPP